MLSVRFRPSRALLLITLMFACAGCNAFAFLRLKRQTPSVAPPVSPAAPAKPGPGAVVPEPTLDPINTVPVDAEHTCSSLSSDGSSLALKPLANAQYDLTVKDLLGTDKSASANFPPDVTGTGFDTGAAHSLTTTLAQAYLDASQSLAADYVASPNASCAEQAFASTCTSTAVVAFAQRAFRRPLFSDESARMAALPQSFSAGGLSDKDAYTASLATVLMAPQFLYRSDVSAGSGVVNADQYALASRLSYALWGSMPDEALLAQAQAGALADPAVLNSEIERLVTHPKALGALRNFTRQWWNTRALAQAPAASQVDPSLTAAFAEETLDYVDDFLTHNINVRHLLDAPFTYANASLATHYGLQPLSGDTMVRVALTGAQRGGLLTQGSFLLGTSNPDDTSPVKRGKWVLDRILCAPPPPPPAGVQVALAPSSGTVLPMRQRLATHRASPTCAGCHVRMDPIGLAFENYNYIGQWRDSDAFGPIDASGSLPTGETFTSAADLAQVLKADPAFPTCLATKLAQYTLGREPTSAEQCLINKIAARSTDESYGLKNMLIDLSRTLLVK